MMHARAHPGQQGVVHATRRSAPRVHRNVASSDLLVRRPGFCRRRVDGRLNRDVTVGIGFDLPGDDNKPTSRPELAAAKTLDIASSLLVYTSLLDTKVGRAFCELMHAIEIKGRREVTVKYGALYKALRVGGYASWQDYVLDQALYARDCPFAARAACGKPIDDALRRAAAQDLNALQAIALADETIIAWVTTACSFLPEGWPAAAAMLEKPDAKLDDAPEPCAEEAYVVPPASEAELQRWRYLVGSKVTWGEAVADLESYHQRHGHAIVSRHIQLRWKEGGFVPGIDEMQSDLEGMASVDLEGVGWVRSVIESEGTAARLLIEGVTGEHNTSRVLWEAAGKAAESGVRVIAVDSGSLKELPQLARSMAKHVRVRFLVVLDNLDLVLSKQAEAGLKNCLDKTMGTNWPDNAGLLCATPTKVSPSLLKLFRQTKALEEEGLGFRV